MKKLYNRLANCDSRGNDRDFSHKTHIDAIINVIAISEKYLDN